MAQLTDLYQGSKSQSAVKFLNSSQLQEYGAGSKYKKCDVDRIMHALVFECVLNETCQQNKG